MAIKTDAVSIITGRLSGRSGIVIHVENYGVQHKALEIRPQFPHRVLERAKARLKLETEILEVRSCTSITRNIRGITVMEKQLSKRSERELGDRSGVGASRHRGGWLLSPPELHPYRMRIDGRTNVGASKAPPRDVTALPHRQTSPSLFVYPHYAPPHYTPAGTGFTEEFSWPTYLDLVNVFKTGHRKWPQRMCEK